MAVEDINAAGGVDVDGTKLPLELIVLDDESDATKTVQNLETLYASDEVVAYLGGFGSDLHAAAAGFAMIIGAPTFRHSAAPNSTAFCSNTTTNVRAALSL